MEFTKLIEAFAKKHGLEAMTIQDGVSALDIDDINVALILNSEEDALTIYGEIGYPTPDASGHFCELMLRANHLLVRTVGAILCQNPESGAYALFRTFPLDSMTEETLDDELGKLVDQVVDWQRLLEGFDAAEEEAQANREEEKTITHSPEGFIQV